MKSNYVLPITIVIAGILIAGAVFWSGQQQTANPGGTDGGAIKARAYDPSIDHIVGNPNASIKLIEYADLECPYCKVFNTTMHQVMDYYGSTGNVAWVFRSFPLAQIHSKAPKEAQAAECAASQGGDAAFFKYIDDIYAITPSENNLDLAELPKIAQQDGLDVTKFNQCLNSGQFAQRVQDSYNEAIAAGGQGTPYTLIMYRDQVVPGGNLSGNQPYNSMRAIVDALLSNIPSSGSSTSSTTAQ